MKTETVLIIGIGGVGKEHIRATQALGLNVIGVDINKKVRDEFLKAFANDQPIFNKWGKTSVIFKVSPFLVYKSIEDVKENYNYVVIATPTETHQKVLDKIPVGIPVLVEKPMNVDIHSENLVGGYMYNFIKGLKPPPESDEHNFVLCVNDHYETKTWRSKDGAGGDLIPHLLGLAFKFYGTNFIQEVVKARNSAYVTLHYSDKTVNLIGLYGKDGCNLTLDGIPMEVDYQQVFLSQMKEFVRGRQDKNHKLIEQFYAAYLKGS